MQINSTKNMGFGCAACEFTKKLMARKYMIEPAKASHFVDLTVNNQFGGKRYMHTTSAQGVLNLVYHLAKTPARLNTFVEKFCKSFPISKV